MHKWDARTGDSSFIGTEIIGYDETRKQFYSYHFDNSGNHPVYTATVDGDKCNFFEKNTKVKITINDEDTITFNWEWKHDGSDWLPLCNRVAKKEK